jgi:UDP-N-acetylmuramoyl-L-alanyl-D-glutamate--2,6-diaminopimelate ligase
MVNKQGPNLTRPQHPPSVTVHAIASWLAEHGVAASTSGDGATLVTGLSLSSQRVRRGDLYLALPGSRTHGAMFAAAAVEAGAVAVLTDPAGSTSIPSGVPGVVVEDPRAVMGGLSDWLYGHPAAAMLMVGVTGTQGKTTTTWLAEAALHHHGVAAAVVGTVGTRIRGQEVKTTLTTPEAPDLHALFAVMREAHVDACLMEVSSHALVLGRVDGIRFDVAVFTNLGRDHLDFHHDLEDYFAAKASLFVPERARRGVISVDDEFGLRLCRDAAIPIRTFSALPMEERPSQASYADWQILSIVTTPMGSQARLRTPDGSVVDLAVPMPGRFNVANAVAAVAACAELGVPPEVAADGIRAAHGVPGRMEWIANERGVGVVVDYAHKPDALEAALGSLRSAYQQRLIVVFGAGGDRDHGKRPLMGLLASEIADVVIVTDDNPRSEDPATIRAEVRSGIADENTVVLEIGDRRAAITRAIELAQPGDVVLIAGKGHETGQEVHGVITDFDDRAVAREALAR